MKPGTRNFRALTPEEFQHLALEQKLAYLSDAFKLLFNEGGAPFRVMQQRPSSPATLGDVLYAGKFNALVLEQEWERLVQSVATGDALALHALYERAHRAVFTLALQIGEDRKIAEEVTVQVFQDVWRSASQYDARNSTVLGWIMNLARRRALDQPRIERGTKRVQARAGSAAFRPAPALQRRLARIADEEAAAPAPSAPRRWAEPQWEKVAPGITCKLLATDAQRHKVSMLVRLAPGATYPAHTHAGVEELHLLHGELWIDRRKLHAGDFSRAEPGTTDKRVWSETGCTCLLTTSTRDTLISS